MITHSKVVNFTKSKSTEKLAEAGGKLTVSVIVSLPGAYCRVGSEKYIHWYSSNQVFKAGRCDNSRFPWRPEPRMAVLAKADSNLPDTKTKSYSPFPNLCSCILRQGDP
jgi:hypothetical protein